MNELDSDLKRPSASQADALQILERVCLHSIREQRRARRWSIFFKMLLAVYVLGFVVVYLQQGPVAVTGSHTAVVNLEGVIGSGDEINSDSVAGSLRAAFENEDSEAIILRINSPGGSPVQAGYINDEIGRLKQKHPDKKVYAVVGDVCASGGYYIAVAADEIYANKASVVGSIGVIMNGFGFVEAMKKLGVERRKITSRENKGMLDPFSPLAESDQQHAKAMVDSIHEQFVNVVKQGRGDRLQQDEQIFSGLFWTGEQALKLGLVDGLGSTGYVAREIIGVEELVDYTRAGNWMDRLVKRLGVEIRNQLMNLEWSPQVRL